MTATRGRTCKAAVGATPPTGHRRPGTDAFARASARVQSTERRHRGAPEKAGPLQGPGEKAVVLATARITGVTNSSTVIEVPCSR